MNITRALLVLSLAFVPVAAGCSHEDDNHHAHARADRTSGDEHGDDHHHVDGARVATRDTDHDGTDDTVAVADTAPTAMDQGEGSADLETTRQIRSAVMGDSSLSFGARNCTIITNGGNVTLRGDVTMAESAAIERHALAAAGVLHVENSLHVTDQAAAH